MELYFIWLGYYCLACSGIAGAGVVTLATAKFMDFLWFCWSNR